MRLPRLYAIIDRTSTTAMSLKELLLALQAGGATLIQYRNKQGAAQEMLSAVRELKRLAASNVKIIMNDRADLSVAAGLDGVHLGQDDLSVGGGRALLPSPRIVGISTHNDIGVGKGAAACRGRISAPHDVNPRSQDRIEGTFGQTTLEARDHYFRRC
jgi:thiamine-phosphate diphosphorylase